MPTLRALRHMQAEQQQEQFNERLSSWIASQGFWFQLRHSIDSSRTTGNLLSHLVSMAFKLLVFMIILSLGGLYYLVKRPDWQAFRTDLRDSISHALGTEELAMRGVGRTRGVLEISRLASDGGQAAFFDFLELRNIRCRMNLVDGLVGQWDPGTISIERLEGQIRAGTDTPEDSAAIGDMIFRQFDDTLIRSIDIANASFGWGYSERTRGSIENAQVELRRVRDSWRISIRGGEFSQNWISNFAIDEIIAVADPDGIVFEKAELRQGSGTLDFSGLRVIAGDRPELRGVARLRGISLDQILPSAARNFVEGRISPDITVGGSTNSAEGVTFEGTVNLDGITRITVRDRIHLLRALSVVDLHNSYRRLDFAEGSFRIKTGSGSLEVRDMVLRGDELATLSGGFIARQPTPRELDEMVASGGDGRGSASGVFDFSEDDSVSLLDVDELERQFTLRQAAAAARAAADGDTGEDERLFDRVGMNYEARLYADQQAERLSRMLIYEGEVLLTVLPNAFERTERLQENFPVDPETGRIPVRVPLEGPLHELTLEQEESIYEMGRR